MSITLALAGDAMLGRGVAEQLTHVAPEELVAGEVRDVASEADLFVLNLECCVSERGQPWPDPGKPFFFRAPPDAVRTLSWLGVDCVSMANNHALDFGPDALLDTQMHLARAGIETAGAGPDVQRAHAPALLETRGTRLAVVAVTDHPEDFAAGAAHPGVAHEDLRTGVPEWLTATVRNPPCSADADRAANRTAEAVLVTPHWGPNMTAEPVPHVRSAARVLTDAGATLVAGHSAHVVHPVAGRVLFDLGGFIDDYAVHPGLRNDLSLLFLVTLGTDGPSRIEAAPLALDYSYTRLARGKEFAAIRDHFARVCANAGTRVAEGDGRLIVEPSDELPP